LRKRTYASVKRSRGRSESQKIGLRKRYLGLITDTTCKKGKKVVRVQSRVKSWVEENANRKGSFRHGKGGGGQDIHLGLRNFRKKKILVVAKKDLGHDLFKDFREGGHARASTIKPKKGGLAPQSEFQGRGTRDLTLQKGGVGAGLKRLVEEEDPQN